MIVSLQFIYATILLRGDVVAFEKGDYKKIVTEYKNSVLYYDAVINYAQSLVEKGDYRKALRFLESNEDEFPSYLIPSFLNLKKEVYKKIKYKDSYKKILKKILINYPLLLDEKELNLLKHMEFYKGRYYFLKGNWKKCVLYFQRTKNRKRHYYLGYCFFKMGDYKKAIQYFKKVLPSDGRWYYEKSKILKGLSYKYTGEVEKSIKEFFRVSREYKSLRENALKEARLVMLENNFYPVEFMSALKWYEKFLIDYDMNINLEGMLKDERTVSQNNIFVLKLLVEQTGKEKLYEKMKSVEPLGLFTVRGKGICYEENSISSYTDGEELLIFAHLNMEDAFKYYIQKINDFELLFSLSEKLNKVGKWFYSLYTARKAYTILRMENHTVCFPLQLLRLLFPLPYKNFIFKRAREKNVNPYLIYAIMRRESMFNERAISPKGAIGLMQIMPYTFKSVEKYKDFAIDSLKNPLVNIDAGIEIISSLIDSLGEVYLAVAAYNAGIHRIKEWKEKGVVRNEFQFLMDCPFEETRKYTFRVLSDYEVYKKLCYE